MKIKHLASATNIISTDSAKILTDPWLEDGEYYGSWFHYPPITPDYDEINSVDAIYISHIHPDHFSRLTLAKIDKSIPILIHKYAFPFLKINIEKLGFNVVEVEHGQGCEIGDITIQIYAADNCDPSQCYKFFGCGLSEVKMGSTTIDTMAIITDGNKTILNVNDCPYKLSEKTLDVILEEHDDIDLLLTGYSGASSYPQCWKFDDYTKHYEGAVKQEYFLKQGKQFIDRVQPKLFIPFAGKYVLGGSRYYLDKDKYNPNLLESLEWFGDEIDIQGFVLDVNQEWEISDKPPKITYTEDIQEKRKYINNVLSKKAYQYEFDIEPTEDDIKLLLSHAFKNLLKKCDELEIKTDTNVYISMFNKWIYISIKDRMIDIVDEVEEPFLTIELDNRLLYRILSGPKYAHWNNAEIGSHLTYNRKPNKYERGLHYCLNYFHANKK